MTPILDLEEGFQTRGSRLRTQETVASQDVEWIVSWWCAAANFDVGRVLCTEDALWEADVNDEGVRRTSFIDFLVSAVDSTSEKVVVGRKSCFVGRWIGRRADPALRCVVF